MEDLRSWNRGILHCYYAHSDCVTVKQILTKEMSMIATKFFCIIDLQTLGLRKLEIREKKAMPLKTFNSPRANSWTFDEEEIKR